jgi:probable FeS assembly SUF system protein SufT
MVPSGDEVKLLAGNLVRITQALGGNYTILINGNMVQISAANADALGFEIEEKSSESDAPKGSHEHQIWDQLKTCYDPEIPINIVELGLIYGLDISNMDEGKSVNIKMTLTAPGCGMGPMIAGEVERKVQAIEGVEKVLVDLVWEPQWNRDMMSEAAQLELGMF